MSYGFSIELPYPLHQEVPRLSGFLHAVEGVGNYDILPVGLRHGKWWRDKQSLQTSVQDHQLVRLEFPTVSLAIIVSFALAVLFSSRQAAVSLLGGVSKPHRNTLEEIRKS